MTCDTPGCTDVSDDWYVWLPTEIRWVCGDCAEQYREFIEKSRVEHRPDDGPQDLVGDVVDDREVELRDVEIDS